MILAIYASVSKPHPNPSQYWCNKQHKRSDTMRVNNSDVQTAIIQTYLNTIKHFKQHFMTSS